MAVSERELGGVRWIVARGPAAEVFSELGALMREEIGAILADSETGRLRERADLAWFAAVTEASVARCPGAWAELAAMAGGAGVSAEDLALLNFRGDLGTFPSGGAGESGGCSDLAWRRSRSFIAHNEDEPASYLGRCPLLTLRLDGQQPVTAFWVPGFLPANAFSVTGTGVVISVDHLPVAQPALAPGRGFVARELQRAVTGVDDAIGLLAENPSAGGFSYTIGDRTGRIAIVESAAGQCGWREVGDDGPIAWHTNHGRYIEAAGTNPHGTSVRRGEILAGLGEPGTEPGPQWFLDALDRVRADPEGARIATTLCSFVADLTSGELVARSRGSSSVSIAFGDLLAG